MKNEADLESQMLDALELFQYAHRYRNQILVFVLENEISLENLVPDLKVISRADIVPVVICQGSQYTGQLVATLAERGLPLKYLPRSVGDELNEQALADSTPLHSTEVDSTGQDSSLGQIRELLGQRTIPVIGFTGDSPGAVTNQGLWEVGINCAHELGASRTFIISDEEGLKRNNALIALLSHSQLKQLRQTGAHLNVDSQLLDLIQNSHEADEFDIVLLAGTSGNLFQEIFTHLGSGTLFTDEHPNVIRKATLQDVFEISNLTKPWVRAGTLLPINDDDIARQIDSFYIYTVNGAVVAATRLSAYGECAQIARVCTLPRYRRRGYARELVSFVTDLARQDGKSMVFGLSVEPLMWQLFRDLGFEETPRELLPEEWKRSYDFSRPSKAFVLELRAREQR